MKIVRRLLLGVSGIVALALLAITGSVLLAVRRENAALEQLGPSAPTVEVDGLHLRDLNKNGEIDPYEDSRLDVDDRIEDLLGRMTIAEKVGLLLRPPLLMERNGTLVDAWGGAFAQGFGTAEAVAGLGLSHFDLDRTASCRATAAWHNRLQLLAERTRLGIPVTVGSAPRHEVRRTGEDAAVGADGFSQWPPPLGLAATQDVAVARRFGEIANQEYRAVGLRNARPLAAPAPASPSGAGGGPLGDDVELATAMLEAHDAGLLGGATVGPESVVPESRFEAPATGASPSDEATGERPAAGGPDDRAPTTGADALGDRVRIFRPDRADVTDEAFVRAMEAGADQLAGPSARDPEPLIERVRNGDLPLERIDASMRRLLREKYRLGLFEQPYVDENAAAEICDQPSFRTAAEEAQRRSLVLLQNEERAEGGPLLPLRPEVRLYVQNVDASVAAHYATVVPTIEEAEVALVRVAPPVVDGAPGERFSSEDVARVRTMARTKPTVFIARLDRPTPIDGFLDDTAATLVDFGVSDEAVLDVLFGRFAPAGKLPFALPSRSPDDEAPFPRGSGLGDEDASD